MIEAISLTKTFGAKVAVSDLTLTVQPGHVFAFLGPNGAGKTTTIKMLVALLRPTSGTVRICGADIRSQPMKAKSALSYVPDQPYLYDKLTGREFLAFVAQIYGLPPSTFEERVSQMTETFELSDFLDELSESYSHGMKQRVVLSAALLHDPRVIIVDEPMVGLDPRTIRLTKDIFRQRASNGATIFMSTHTLSVAEELADDIGIIHHGRMIARGSLETLRRQASTEGTLEDAFLQLTAEQNNG
jgi:ABC-2 type transport system ATP-binding protein